MVFFHMRYEEKQLGYGIGGSKHANNIYVLRHSHLDVFL